MTARYRLLFLSLVVFCSCGPEKSKCETREERISEYEKCADSTSSRQLDFKFWDTVISIYFKEKSLQISPSDTLRLNQLSSFCVSDQVGYIKMVGFTDTTGTEAQNEILAKKRVEKVFKYLDRQSKIRSDAVYLTWLGESKDAYDLHFEPTHPQQNCVDIWFQLRQTSR